MSEFVSPVQSDIPTFVERVFYLLGTGAAVPTIVNGGLGATLTRTSAGLYSIVWKENPGAFLGIDVGLQGSTPSSVAALMGCAGTYSATTFTLPVLVQTTAGVATDLTSAQNMFLRVFFKKTGKGV